MPRFQWISAVLGICASSGAGLALGWSHYAISALVLMALVLAILVLGDLGAFADRIGRLPNLLLLLVWSACSITWAPDVLDATGSWGAMTIAVLLGGAIATRFSGMDAARLIFGTLCALAVASVLVAELFPSIGTIVTSRPGIGATVRPVGLFDWNSRLGIVSAFGAVLGLGLWFERRNRTYFLLTLVVVAVVAYSQSATSVVACVGGLVAVVWKSSAFARPVMNLACALILVGLPTRTLERLYAASLQLLGRSVDLTGRSGIWRGSIDLIKERPLLGYGIGNAPASATQSSGMNVDNAHNGYLQVMIELGIIGLLVFGVLVTVAVVRAVSVKSTWLFGCLTVFLISNSANNYTMTSGITITLMSWIWFSLRDPRWVIARRDQLHGASRKA